MRPVARLLFAFLGPSALSRHVDAKLASHRALSDEFEEVECRAGGSVMFGANRPFDAAALAWRAKQFEEIGPAIHHADLARVGQRGDQIVALAKTIDPGEGLLLFDRYVRRRVSVCTERRWKH